MPASPAPENSPLRIPLQILRGFAMGAADIVPGVSGGTMALVFGIYRDLITNVRTGATALGRFVKGDVSGGLEELRRVDWLFLLPLGAGVGLALLALTSLIEGLLERQPVRMAGVFFGLVIASIIVAWRMLERRDPVRLAIIAAVGVIMFFLLDLRSGALNDPSILFFFGAGAIAICAMILPGVSGSFLLLMLGMYAPVLAAANDRRIGVLAVFMVGCVIGLAVFSQLLNWAMEHHEATVMAALIGLMLGSLRVLWPWPDGVGILEEHDEAGATITEGTSGTALAMPSGDVLIPLLLAIAAGTIVIAVSSLADRRTVVDPASI